MSDPHPRSASDLIDLKGGPAAFAASTGLGHGAVRMMKVRNKLPRGAWPEIMDAFPDITLEVLRRTEMALAKDEVADTSFAGIQTDRASVL